MLGVDIVQSIGKSTENWVSMSISDIFQTSRTSPKRLRCPVVEVQAADKVGI